MTFWKNFFALTCVLGHLACPCVPLRPGADGLTLDEVLGSDPEAVAAGQVPGLEELLTIHPDLAEALKVFFKPGGKEHEEK
jgi:hypothetical protein